MELSISLCLFFAAITHAHDYTPRQYLPDIYTCLTTSLVPFALPNTTLFNTSISPFNLRLPFTPVAVAIPTTVPQVQAAVLCGASLNLTVSAKSGGHSYASDGIGGEDGHLMVDMKYFYDVQLDNGTGIAAVGPGARLGNVATALWEQGEAALSHGTCPGVGIAGHALHGGYGMASHTYGLALDLITSLDAVLADGSLVTASNTSNTDLFWALQGAGSSFGIVTSLSFQTFPAPVNNTVFSYTYFWNESQARDAFALLQNYANTTMAPEMNMRLYVSSFVFSLQGVYYGDQDAFEAEIDPLLDAFGTGLGGTVQTMGWIDMLENYAYGTLVTPLDYDLHETFFAKSLMTVAVADDAMDAFWSYYTTTAKQISRDWYLIIDLHGGPNSSISAVPSDATSYTPRTSLLKYEFYDRVDSGSYPGDGFSFLDGWVDTIKNVSDQAPVAMYMNYVDPSLSAEEAHDFYWGDNYARLEQIKLAVDPNQVFSNPQAVLRN